MQSYRSIDQWPATSQRVVDCHIDHMESRSGSDDHAHGEKILFDFYPSIAPQRLLEDEYSDHGASKRDRSSIKLES